MAGPVIPGGYFIGPDARANAFWESDLFVNPQRPTVSLFVDGNEIAVGGPLDGRLIIDPDAGRRFELTTRDLGKRDFYPARWVQDGGALFPGNLAEIVFVEFAWFGPEDDAFRALIPATTAGPASARNALLSRGPVNQVIVDFDLYALLVALLLAPVPPVEVDSFLQSYYNSHLAVDLELDSQRLEADRVAHYTAKIPAPAGRAIVRLAQGGAIDFAERVRLTSEGTLADVFASPLIVYASPLALADVDEANPVAVPDNVLVLDTQPNSELRAALDGVPFGGLLPDPNNRVFLGPVELIAAFQAPWFIRLWLATATVLERGFVGDARDAPLRVRLQLPTTVSDFYRAATLATTQLVDTPLSGLFGASFRLPGAFDVDEHPELLAQLRTAYRLSSRVYNMPSVVLAARSTLERLAARYGNMLLGLANPADPAVPALVTQNLALVMSQLLERIIVYLAKTRDDLLEATGAGPDESRVFNIEGLTRDIGVLDQIRAAFIRARELLAGTNMVNQLRADGEQLPGIIQAAIAAGAFAPYEAGVLRAIGDTVYAGLDQFVERIPDDFVLTVEPATGATPPLPAPISRLASKIAIRREGAEGLLARAGAIPDLQVLAQHTLDVLDAISQSSVNAGPASFAASTQVFATIVEILNRHDTGPVADVADRVIRRLAADELIRTIDFAPNAQAAMAELRLQIIKVFRGSQRDALLASFLPLQQEFTRLSAIPPELLTPADVRAIAVLLDAMYALREQTLAEIRAPSATQLIAQVAAQTHSTLAPIRARLEIAQTIELPYELWVALPGVMSNMYFKLRLFRNGQDVGLEPIVHDLRQYPQSWGGLPIARFIVGLGSWGLAPGDNGRFRPEQDGIYHIQVEGWSGYGPDARLVAIELSDPVEIILTAKCLRTGELYRPADANAATAAVKFVPVFSDWPTGVNPQDPLPARTRALVELKSFTGVPSLCFEFGTRNPEIVIAVPRVADTAGGPLADRWTWPELGLNSFFEHIRMLVLPDVQFTDQDRDVLVDLARAELDKYFTVRATVVAITDQRTQAQNDDVRAKIRVAQWAELPTDAFGGDLRFPVGQIELATLNSERVFLLSAFENATPLWILALGFALASQVPNRSHYPFSVSAGERLTPVYMDAFFQQLALEGTVCIGTPTTDGQIYAAIRQGLSETAAEIWCTVKRGTSPRMPIGLGHVAQLYPGERRMHSGDPVIRAPPRWLFDVKGAAEASKALGLAQSMGAGGEWVGAHSYRSRSIDRPSFNPLTRGVDPGSLPMNVSVISEARSTATRLEALLEVLRAMESDRAAADAAGDARGVDVMREHMFTALDNAAAALRALWMLQDDTSGVLPAVIAINSTTQYPLPPARPDDVEAAVAAMLAERAIPEPVLI